MSLGLLSQLEQGLHLIEPYSAVVFNKRLSLIAVHVDRVIFETELHNVYALSAHRNFIQRSHLAHGRFIANAAELQSPHALLETLLWAYRNYPAHGISTDYFELMFAAWRDATLTVMSDEGADIAALFTRLLTLHPTLCEAAAIDDEAMSLPEEIASLVDQLIERLLSNDEEGTQEILESHITQVSQIPFWWEDIMTPALRRIGALWAINNISVAEEHAATAIAQRVMNRVHPRVPSLPQSPLSTAVLVTPGEQHKLGAVMLRDLLELSGFSVFFSDAEISLDTTVALLQAETVRAVLISTTLPENLMRVRDVITTLRDSLPALRYVIVGGRAYDADPGLAEIVGADRFFSAASEARDYLLQVLSLEEYQGVG